MYISNTNIFPQIFLIHVWSWIGGCGTEGHREADLVPSELFQFSLGAAMKGQLQASN